MITLRQLVDAFNAQPDASNSSTPAGVQWLRPNPLSLPTGPHVAFTRGSISLEHIVAIVNGIKEPELDAAQKAVLARAQGNTGDNDDIMIYDDTTVEIVQGGAWVKAYLWLYEENQPTEEDKA